MAQQLGLDDNFFGANSCLKTKFRWLLVIPDVSASGVNTLPPKRSARPAINLREKEINHVTEVVKMTARAEFEPLELTLYDTVGNNHPVFEWLKLQYDPQYGTWYKPDGSFRKDAYLYLYDGCGNTVETWKYESCRPQFIDWGELDMSNGSDVVTVDLRLSYDRAWRA